MIFDALIAGGAIKTGIYSIPEARGPNAGTYRVEIRWNKPTGRQVPNPTDPPALMDEMQEGLPAKYRDDSESTADVGPDQTTFDVELKVDEPR